MATTKISANALFKDDTEKRRWLATIGARFPMFFGRFDEQMMRAAYKHLNAQYPDKLDATDEEG